MVEYLLEVRDCMKQLQLLLMLVTLLFITACNSTGEDNKTATEANEVEKVDTYNKNKSNSTNLVQTDQVKKETGNSSKEQNNPEQKKVVLDVPLIKQNPELRYGCEVTSLAMVLNYAGVKVNKMELADKLKKDYGGIEKTSEGDITKWGDPDEGFVGDITGKNPGYAVFDKPMEDLMNQYLKNRTLNLTGEPFNVLLKQVENKKPVVVWTTGDYKQPDRWESWKHEKETIKTPLDLHAVVLVGYEDEYVYLNDPLSGKKDVKVSKEAFINSWIALEKRALSYR